MATLRVPTPIAALSFQPKDSGHKLPARKLPQVKRHGVEYWPAMELNQQSHISTAILWQATIAF